MPQCTSQPGSLLALAGLLCTRVATAQLTLRHREPLNGIYMLPLQTTWITPWCTMMWSSGRCGRPAPSWGQRLPATIPAAGCMQQALCGRHTVGPHLRAWQQPRLFEPAGCHAWRAAVQGKAYAYGLQTLREMGVPVEGLRFDRSLVIRGLIMDTGECRPVLPCRPAQPLAPLPCQAAAASGATAHVGSTAPAHSQEPLTSAHYCLLLQSWATL